MQRAFLDATFSSAAEAPLRKDAKDGQVKLRTLEEATEPTHLEEKSISLAAVSGRIKLGRPLL